MDQEPAITVRGPRFWAILAAISGFGTLSSLFDVILEKPLHIADAWHEKVSFPVILITCLCSAVGFGTMWIGNFSDTGRMVIRGRPLSPESMKSVCSVLYLLPWAYLFLLSSASTYRR
jgi:hypothetical protein